jgi:hypothetical protein
MRNTLFSKIQSASILALLIVVSANGTVRAQNKYQTASLTTNIPAGTSISITSGDLAIGLCNPANLVNADARLASPQGAVFSIGQLQLTVRYLDESNAVLAAITLPTAPDVGNLPVMNTSNAYYTSLWAPMTFASSDVPATFTVTVRATAVVKNTTTLAHLAKLTLDLLSSGGGC